MSYIPTYCENLEVSYVTKVEEVLNIVTESQSCPVIHGIMC